MPQPIIIVGAGQSAAQAVVSLRQLGETAEIVMLGDNRIRPISARRSQSRSSAARPRRNGWS